MDDPDVEQKGLENLILLILGEDNTKLSVLHLEKEAFLLWNFNSDVKPFLDFIKYYRGPFSREIHETIRHPVFCIKCWEYIPPNKKDKLSGGYIKLTQKGVGEYRKLYQELKNIDKVFHLLTGIKMVRRLYDKLTLEELLLLIYDSYPEYTEKSIVYDNITKRKEKLSKGLLKKGVIDTERFQSIVTF